MLLNRGLPRFIVIGGICFSVNLVVLYVGTDLLGWHYMMSMLLSIMVANTLGWLLNHHWTFSPSGLRWWTEYGRYMSVCISSSLIGALLMVFAVSLIGVHYLLANVVIAVLMLLVNFWAHRDWSFASSRVKGGVGVRADIK